MTLARTGIIRAAWEEVLCRQFGQLRKNRKKIERKKHKGEKKTLKFFNRVGSERLLKLS